MHEEFQVMEICIRDEKFYQQCVANCGYEYQWHNLIL